MKSMSRNLMAARASAVLLTLLGTVLPYSVQGDIVFSDNFNSYSPKLNWTPPANWTAPGPGTVDLIGKGFVDLYPGNGFYVDLDGSNELPGTLQTNQTFGPGTYTLSFDLGGNARGDIKKTTDITLGNFTDSITLASQDPLQLHTLTFATNGGQLVFSDLPGGDQNIGNILDNVTLSTNPVPEPASWAMMLMGLGGVILTMRFARTRNSSATRQKASDRVAAAS